MNEPGVIASAAPIVRFGDLEAAVKDVYDRGWRPAGGRWEFVEALALSPDLGDPTMKPAHRDEARRLLLLICQTSHKGRSFGVFVDADSLAKRMTEAGTPMSARTVQRRIATVRDSWLTQTRAESGGRSGATSNRAYYLLCVPSSYETCVNSEPDTDARLSPTMNRDEETHDRNEPEPVARIEETHDSFERVPDIRFRETHDRNEPEPDARLKETRDSFERESGALTTTSLLTTYTSRYESYAREEDPQPAADREPTRGTNVVAMRAAEARAEIAATRRAAKIAEAERAARRTQPSAPEPAPPTHESDGRDAQTLPTLPRPRHARSLEASA